MTVKGIIMAGGKGERFWPQSRTKSPKQLLAITGGNPMLRNTVERLMTFLPAKDIMVITSASYVPSIRKMASELPPFNIIGEPVGRNTAPCIGLAAVSIKEEDGIMMMFPADHVIHPVQKFVSTLKNAIALAEKTDNLITIGIRPTRPSTAYGYIKAGTGIKGSKDAFHVERFVEKPDEETAKKFLGSGGYFWNGGIFVWRKSVILKALKENLPHLHSELLRITKNNIARIYPSLEKISIDYGVLEKIKNRLVVAADFDWNDVGSWEALEKCFPHDKNANIKTGNVLAFDTTNSMIFGKKNLIATLGVSNLIIVSTDDAVLVLEKGRGEEVKKIVQCLQKDKKYRKYL